MILKLSDFLEYISNNKGNKNKTFCYPYFSFKLIVILIK